MILQDSYALPGGVTIPKLGLGTWLVDDDAVGDLVLRAIKIGYRHIDTAQAYGNEHGVGQGLRASGISRDDIFLTTKLAAESKSFADARARIDGSLKALAVDHIDLMLIHNPQPWSQFRKGEHFFEGNLEAWRALEEAHASGKIRAIGVSNFERTDLDNILDNASVKPMVNQVLAHVGNTPFDLINHCRNKGVLVEAYSPIAHGAVLNNQVLDTMAKRYGVSIAQLCIRYCLELGLLPLPKTTSAAHLRDNATVDFVISETDMAALVKAERDTDYGEASSFPVFAQ